MLRTALFIFFASAIWALLPLTASRQLHLGSGGYGLLLGCVGIGAVAGAALLPRLRLRVSPGGLLTAGSLSLAVVALLLGSVHVTALIAVALILGGLAWILALSSLNSLYQLTLPGWVKARGMSYYLIVFQGGNAVGSAVMGITAERAGLSATLLIAATGLALGPLPGSDTGSNRSPPTSCSPPVTGPRRSSPPVSPPAARSWSASSTTPGPDSSTSSSPPSRYPGSAGADRGNRVAGLAGRQ